MYIQRLENFTMKMNFTEIRKRALIVLTSGEYNNSSCHVRNAFVKRKFSGLMKNSKRKSSRPLEHDRDNAWFTTDSIVAKVSQFAYDYVCFNLIDEKYRISKIAENLSQVWKRALIIQVRYSKIIHTNIPQTDTLSMDAENCTDSVYKIADVCPPRSTSPRPRLQLM